MRTKNKWIFISLLAFLIFTILVGGIYTRAHLNNYRGVSCIDCFNMTNYLHSTNQRLLSEEFSPLYGDTIEELSIQLMDWAYWKCENCARIMASEFLYFDDYPSDYQRWSPRWFTP